MNITVNGKARELQDGLSVHDLLVLFDLAGERVAVEMNGQIIDRSGYEITVLHEADTVEVVRFVGGG